MRTRFTLAFGVTAFVLAPLLPISSGCSGVLLQPPPPDSGPAGDATTDTGAGSPDTGSDAACHGDQATWAALTNGPIPCTKNSDCCVIINDCLSESQIVGASNEVAAKAAWPYCDRCNRCIAPAVEVFCKADGTCGGTALDIAALPDSGVNYFADHCGIDGPPTGNPASTLLFTCGATTSGPDAGPDAGRCTEPLASAAARNECPATYAAAVDQCNANTKPFLISLLANCGGLNAVVRNWNTHSSLCLYAEGVLVGAQAESDINEFCGNTDYLITGGNVPDACWYPWLRILETGDGGATPCEPPDGGKDATAD